MQKQILIGIGALLLVAAGAYVVVSGGLTTGTGNLETESTTNIVASGDGVEVGGSGHGTIAVAENQNNAVIPDYKEPLSIADSLSAEVRNALSAQFEVTVAALAKDETDFAAWNNLAILRKTAGDYAGAEEIWIYVSKVFPSSAVPFNNLGVLYMDFLKDYAKAEVNFKRAVTNNSGDVNAYQQLVSLYTVYGYKDKAAALELIEQGLRDNPSSQSLLQLKTQVQAL